MKKIKALVFDIGGVLEFVHFNEFYKQAFNISSKDDLRFQKINEQKLRRELDISKITLEEYFSELISKCKVNFNFEEYIQTFRKFTDFNEELISYISKNLKKKFKLFILSNNSEIFMYDEKRQFYSKSFKKQFYSYELKMRKPNEKVFEHLISELNLKPEEIVFIDDKEDNVFSAEKIGMKGFVYSDLTSFKHFINSLEEY